MPKKKITVDKDFLELVLKEVKELKKKIEKSEEKPKVQEITPILPVISPEKENYLFQCMAIAPYNILPENQLEFNMKVNQFGEELKMLMKKYNFVRSTGEFFAKNIQ